MGESIFIFWILFYITAPALLISLVRRFAFLNKLGVTVVTYFLGMFLGNIGIFENNHIETQDTIAGVFVLLAIPLVLFSSNFASGGIISKNTAISVVLGIISITITTISGFFLFHENLPEPNKTAAMLMGLYTGGTTNLAAIKTALAIEPENYIVVHSYDSVIGAFYLMMIISFSKRVLSFLPQTSNNTLEHKEKQSTEEYELEHIKELFVDKKYKDSLKAFGVSLLIVILGILLTLAFPKKLEMIVLTLSITTLSIVSSFIPKVNQLTTSSKLGNYLILVFSLIVSTMVDFSKLNLLEPSLLLYIIYATFATFFIQLVLSYFFRVDAGTLLITATALLMSPPFVPIVATAHSIRDKIVPGIMVGIIGYAVGNYLGIFIAWLLA